MSSGTTPDRRWETYSELVARTEAAVYGPASDELFHGILNDVAATMREVQHLSLALIRDENKQLLATVAGSETSDPQSVLYTRDVSECVAIEFQAGVHRADPDEGRVVAESLNSIAELLVTAVARSELRRRERQSRQIQRLGDLNHNIDARRSIAEQLAVACDAQRVTLFQSRPSIKLLACSTSTDIDTRSPTYARLKTIAERHVRDASQSETPDSTDGADKDLHPTVLDFCGGRVVAIVEATGVVELLPTELRLAFDAVLFQVVSHSQGFLSLASHPARASRTGMIAGAVAFVAAILLCVVPIPIRIEAEGRLIPLAQHRLHAPVEGTVQEVMVTSGQLIQPGDALCRFSSHQLALREATLLGDLLTTQKKLAIANARRGEQEVDLASDRNVLETRIGELQKQLAIVDRRKQTLTATSPIGGRVEFLIDQDSGGLAAGRPVQAGQAMIRVVSVESGFLVELDVPERDTAYVIDEHQSTDSLHCNFRLKSSPALTHRGTVKHVDETVRRTEDGRSVLRVIVEPRESVPDAIADSGVFGRIRCGSGPVGFVLFRRLIETVRFKLL